MSEKTAYLHIEGMHCTNCKRRIERSVMRMNGIKNVEINVTTNKGRIIYNRRHASEQALLERIHNLGFKADVIDHLTKIYEDKLDMPWRLLFSAILTIPLTLVMLSHMSETISQNVSPILLHPYTQFSLAFTIQFIIGAPFYERAYSALREKTTNMDVLVVMSTSIAFFYSYYVMVTTIQSELPPLFYDTSAYIITFILLGRYLEQRTKRKTTIALQKLIRAQKQTATVLEGNQEKTIPTEQIQKGAIVIVKPGDQIPVDGNIISGKSEVDESLLTGENIPVIKRTDSPVYAGTTNHLGLLFVKVVKPYEETILAQIIMRVQEAQLMKAPIERLADKITAIFIPIILSIAIITFFFSYLYLHPHMVDLAIKKVIAVLIIACPCALGLATPTSIMAASGRAAQLGILFKKGEYIERLSTCSHVVLDKTGTITTGAFKVTNLHVVNKKEQYVFQMIAAVEQYATHPIGKAIYTFAKTKVNDIPKAIDVKVNVGEGIEAVVNGKQVSIRNQLLNPLHMNKVSTLANKWRREGKIVSFIYINDKLVAIVAVQDEVKRETIATIQKLRQLRMTPIIASGDNYITTKMIAKQAQITKWYANCTPEDKAELIQSLQAKGHHVVMVGDGINDAPALASANVGIALASGSDLAIYSSDITSLTSYLQHITQAIMLSKKTMRNIRQNFAWAFFYNILMIPFAVFGIIPPSLAALTMAFSSITVLLNALRLTRVHL